MLPNYTLCSVAVHFEKFCNKRRAFLHSSSLLSQINHYFSYISSAPEIIVFLRYNFACCTWNRVQPLYSQRGDSTLYFWQWSLGEIICTGKVFTNIVFARTHTHTHTSSDFPSWSRNLNQWPLSYILDSLIIKWLLHFWFWLPGKRGEKHFQVYRTKPYCRDFTSIQVLNQSLWIVLTLYFLL